MAIRLEDIQLASSGNHLYPLIKATDATRLRVQSTNGYVDIGSGTSSSWGYILTDRPSFYVDKPVSFDGNIQGYGGDETARFNSFIDSGNTAYYLNPAGTSILSTLTMYTNGATETTQINMPRAGFITFYGDNSQSHSISSRNNSGNTADDLRINTYGALYINLDSNNNNTSAANFMIGRHGGQQGTISDWAFKIDGETFDVGIGTTTNSDGDLSINAPKLHVKGVDTSGAFNLIARFQGGNDSDNTGAAILINHNNDRGLLLSAGRKDSDREVAYFDLVSSGANITRMFEIGKYGSDYISKFAKPVEVTGNITGSADISASTFTASSKVTTPHIHHTSAVSILNGSAAQGLSVRHIFAAGTYNTTPGQGDVWATSDMRAPIFYDYDNTSYYVNPAGTSVMNDIEIEDYIYHKGDTNTYLYFETDSIKLRTGGTDRLTLTNSSATFANNVRIPVAWDSGTLENNAIYAKNSTDGFGFGNGTGISTWFAWSTENGLRRMIDCANSGEYINLRTANTDRVQINSSGLTMQNSGDINVGNIRIVGDNDSADQGTAWIRSNGDYIVINPVDGEHLYLNWDTGTSGGSGHVKAAGAMYATQFIDRNNTNYYLDPNGTTALRTVGAWHADSHTWSGEQVGKMQYHSNWWYLQTTNGVLIRNASGANNITLAADGIGTANASWRAPIFYDSDNTSYYVNPAGTSNLSVVTAGTLNVVSVNASQGVKTPNQRTNYLAHKWVAGSSFPQAAVFDGSFQVNGSSSENVLEYGVTPSGGRGLLWKATNNDASSNADGGWAKNIADLSDDKSYISICYVKRVGSNTSGSFYHGCHGSHTLNMDGTANTNPYFMSTNIGNLTQDVWCVSIGVIQANNDSNTGSWSDIDGVYRLDTGERILDNSTFKMKDGSTSQSHRTYLYYSTNSSAELHWYNPGFYEINGQEPSLNEILNRDRHLKFNGNLNVQGTTNLESDLTIASAGDANSPSLRINNASSNTYNHSIESLNSNLTSGETELIVVGKEGSTKNSGYIGYYWSAAGSDDNYITFGHWSANHLLRIHGSGSVVASTNMQAPIFYDSDNTGAYVNPAGDSAMHSIGLDDLLFHNGDGDTHLSFGTNQVKFTAGGTERLRVEGDVKVLGTTDFNIQGTSRRLQFTAGTGTVRTTTANNLILQANSITRQTLSTGGYSEEAGSYRAPIFYDSDNTTYYANPAGTSNMNEITAVSYVRSLGNYQVTLDGVGAGGPKIEFGGTNDWDQYGHIGHLGGEYQFGTHNRDFAWYQGTTKIMELDYGGGNQEPVLAIGWNVAADNTKGTLQVFGHNNTDGTLRLGPHSSKGSTFSHVHYGSNGDWYIRPASSSGSVFVLNYSAISDERLKENIVDSEYGLSEITSLRPRNFNWIDSSTDDVHTGFVAQEVEAVVPKWITQGELDDHKSVDYNAITATLVKAVQELKAENEDLLNRVKALENE